MREVWGVYSVADHLAKNAFVADVMLYDRLVIPVAADDDHERWRENDWNEPRQKHILGILRDRAVQVVWDESLRNEWKTRRDAANAVGKDTSRAAMRLTPTVLVQKIPKNVTGVVAVPTFDSVDKLRAETNIRENALIPGAAQGELAAVIGRKFLVPDDPNLSGDDLLTQAVILSRDDQFRRKRASYWRWQNEFLRDATILDRAAVNASLEEMNDLIADEQAAAKAAAQQSIIRLGTSFAFAVGAATAGLLVPPVAPVALHFAPAALAGAFLSLGGWVIDHVPSLPPPGGREPEPSPAAICISARQEFGWA